MIKEIDYHLPHLRHFADKIEATEKCEELGEDNSFHYIIVPTTFGAYNVIITWTGTLTVPEMEHAGFVYLP